MCHEQWALTVIKRLRFFVLIWGNKLLQTAVMRAAAAVVRPLWGVVSTLVSTPLTRLPSGALQRIGVVRWGDGWAGTGCCEQVVLSKAGQTVGQIPSDYYIKTWRVNDFKIAAVCHLALSKFTVYVTWLFFGILFCFILQKFAAIRRSLAELCRKTISKKTTVRHLEF